SDALVEACVDQYGRIDEMFANAGGRVGPDADFWNFPTDVFEDTLRTNLHSSFFACRAASSRIIEQGEGGVLVTTASGSAFRGNQRFAYPTSKGAVLSLTKTMATQLAGHGIRVNTIVPGFVSQRPAADDRERAEREQRGRF